MKTIGTRSTMPSFGCRYAFWWNIYQREMLYVRTKIFHHSRACKDGLLTASHGGSGDVGLRVSTPQRWVGGKRMEKLMMSRLSCNVTRFRLFEDGGTDRVPDAGRQVQCCEHALLQGYVTVSCPSMGALRSSLEGCKKSLE